MTNGSVDLTRWQREQGQLNIYAIPSYTPDAYQFGFWQSFFASGHYLLWESLLHRIFVNRPKRFTRSLVIDKLERIRLFRNRIAHHEQIISHDPLVRYADMRDLITWLDPAQAAWLDHYCQVPGVWKEIQEQQADRGWVGF